jgi:dihydropyrimidinase
VGLLIKNAKLVSAEEIIDGDILIEGEKIKSIGENISKNNHKVIDAEGKYIFPGVIDAHTHYHLVSRNSTTADDFYTGTVSAAHGGVTTIVDYIDQDEEISLLDSFKARKGEAEGNAVIDYTFHQSIYILKSGLKDELKELIKAGISNLKMFTTYKEEGYMLPEENWSELFEIAKNLKLLITVHSEDNEIINQIKEGYCDRDSFPPYFHPILRPSEVEYSAIKKLGKEAIKHNIPIYIVHLSSQKGYEALKEIRKEGGKIYAETTPHYLLLTKDLLYKKDAQKYIMTPPLRTGEDNKALWQAVEMDDIEVIDTDHCAFTIKQKLRSNNCLNILPGIPGSETLLPLIYNFGVREGRIDLKKMVKLLSTGAAKIFGLYPEKGSLKPGTDADLVIFDPDHKVTISNKQQHTAAAYTPYHNFEVKGYPVMTISRGEIIVENDTFVGNKGIGRFIKEGKSILI